MSELENQQKVMELVVDKVLRKHGVLENKPDLSEEEKEKIADIVQHIKNDVENFLENSQVAKTELDFPEGNLSEEVEETERVVKNKSVFTSANDLKSVKTFFNK
ncbi:hypothetical protein BKP35_01540 [Anaerobacillus arseniciselenatis]|uniref:Uncharacterized protein n=1 Tax=Anaerobacillus arseniciselenatis TaxID=85682 RepID=A0A1S2LU74_9BACI|nr:hypothetical protein [Anaerobacillus arseniciselenatis]OIJ15703.1 hypothetical protein BKP35_01540 [Anaerobacillus arseniciselenatis]